MQRRLPSLPKAGNLCRPFQRLNRTIAANKVAGNELERLEHMYFVETQIVTNFLLTVTYTLYKLTF